MKIAVYDSYVTDEQGRLMHFDVIVPSDTAPDKVLEFGKAYLNRKNKQVKSFTSRECRFCHTEAASPEIESAIKADGCFIYEMEGCG